MRERPFAKVFDLDDRQVLVVYDWDGDREEYVVRQVTKFNGGSVEVSGRWPGDDRGEADSFASFEAYDRAKAEGFVTAAAKVAQDSFVEG